MDVPRGITRADRMENKCLMAPDADILGAECCFMKTSRYRILGEVGQGQFGKVFCGNDRITGQLVALKSLTHYKFTTRQFLKELAVLVCLKHPNIVSFHAVEYNDTGRYIVMDYCQGGTLRHLMESKQDVPMLQKLQIIRDILWGLEHAHGHNVIHCDLKPENILLNVASHGWTAQIADFGIAQFLERSSASSGHSGHTGSPAYMAPERFYGHYSPESDIYAVGVLLYELLRGKRPFSGMPADIMKAHLNQPFRLPKSLPIVLRAVLRKALQKLPQHRYASAQYMGLAIETAIASLTHDEQVMSHTLPVIVGSDRHPASSSPDAPIITLSRDALQVCQGLPDGVDRLWTRPQGCFMAVQCPDGIRMMVAHTDGTCQDLGILPYGYPPLDQPTIPLPTCLDLDPQGRWLTVVQPYAGAIAPIYAQEPHSASVVLPFEADGEATHDHNPARLLQIFRLPDLQQVCQKQIDHSVHQLWMIDSRHILIAQPMGLNLWNRRGAFYWSYPFSIPIRQAVPSPAVQHQCFAITDEENTTGLWIDLRPFKVKRLPLNFHANWVIVLPWGYLLASPSGELRGLNQRGRVVLQAQLPVAEGERVVTLSTIASTTLWIVIENNVGQILYTLDLSPYLPSGLICF